MTKYRLLTAWAAIAMVLPTATWSDSARDVFKKVSPSIVKVSDAAGSGSGVVISKRGLIVTNLHVVASVFPIKVKALTVTPRGEKKAVTFDKVKIIAVHPKHDAALLYVDVGKASLIPARFNPGTVEVTKGETCYAIGNPLGAGRILEKTITEGVVNHTSREIEGLEYIQTDAAVNPGNSGGALCNKSGEVIGIVTFKLLEKKRLNFAIPTSSLGKDTFVAPEKRQDERRSRVLRAVADAMYRAAFKTADGDEREMFLSVAKELRRKSMFYDEKYAGRACLDVAHVEFLLDNIGLAEAYMEHAMKLLKGTHDYQKWATYHATKGGILADKGKTEEAVKSWLEGCRRSHGEMPGFICADNLAVYYRKKKDYERAAFFMRCALSQKPAGDHKHRVNFIAECGKHISVAQFKYLQMNSITNYDLDDLKAFLKLKSKKGDIVVLKPRSPGIDEKHFRKVTEGAGRKVIPGHTKSLPASPWNAVLAYGGAYIIMAFHEMNRLGVFSVAEERFVKWIHIRTRDTNPHEHARLQQLERMKKLDKKLQDDWKRSEELRKKRMADNPSLKLPPIRRPERVKIDHLTKPLKLTKPWFQNVFIAAGGKHLVFIHPRSLFLEKWDLETLRRVDQFKLSIEGKLSCATMGLDNGDRVALKWRWNGGDRIGLLDLRSKKVVEIGRPEVAADDFRIGRGMGESMLLLDASGRMLTTGFDRRFAHCRIRTKGTNVFSLTAAEDALRMSACFVLGDAGTFYTSDGAVLGKDGQVIKRYTDSTLLPVHGDPRYYLQLNRKTKAITIRDVIQHNAAIELKLAKLQLSNSSWSSAMNHGGLIARVWAVGPLRRLVVLERKARIWNLDLPRD